MPRLIIDRVGAVLAGLALVVALAACGGTPPKPKVLVSGQLTTVGGYLSSPSGEALGVPQDVLGSPVDVVIKSTDTAIAPLPAGLASHSGFVTIEVSRDVSAGESWFLVALPVDDLDAEGVGLAIYDQSGRPLDGESAPGWRLLPTTIEPNERIAYATLKAIPAGSNAIQIALVTGGMSLPMLSEDEIASSSVLDGSVPLRAWSRDLTGAQLADLNDELDELHVIEKLAAAGFTNLMMNGVPRVLQLQPPILELDQYVVWFTEESVVCDRLGLYIPLDASVQICLNDASGPTFNASSFLSSVFWDGQTVAEVVVHEVFHGVQLGHAPWCKDTGLLCAPSLSTAQIAFVEATARLSQRTLLDSPLFSTFPPKRSQVEPGFLVTTPVFDHETRYQQQDFWHHVVEGALGNRFGNLRALLEEGTASSAMTPEAIDQALTKGSLGLGALYQDFALQMVVADDCSANEGYQPALQRFHLQDAATPTNPVGIPVPLSHGGSLSALTTDFLLLELNSQLDMPVTIRVSSEGGELDVTIFNVGDCSVVGYGPDTLLELTGGTPSTVFVVVANTSAVEAATDVSVVVDRPSTTFRGTATSGSSWSSSTTSEQVIRSCPEDHQNDYISNSTQSGSSNFSAVIEFVGSINLDEYTYELQILSNNASLVESSQGESRWDAYQYNPVANEHYHYFEETSSSAGVSHVGSGRLEGGDQYVIPYTYTEEFAWANSGGSDSSTTTTEEVYGVSLSFNLQELLSTGTVQINESSGLEGYDDMETYTTDCQSANRQEYKFWHAVVGPSASYYTLSVSLDQ